MDHCTQTADGLAFWIERRQHTPAELRIILLAALRDAERRGERMASPIALKFFAPPKGWYTCARCSTLFDGQSCPMCDGLAAPADPAPEGVANQAAPLNAHVGRRVPQTSWIEDTNAAIDAAREGLARLGPAFREAA